MGNKSLLSVRIDKDLYNKFLKNQKNKSEVIRVSLMYYFAHKGLENKTLHDNFNSDIIQILRDQVDDLRTERDRLLSQNEALMVSSIPLLSRIKMKLLK